MKKRPPRVALMLPFALKDYADILRGLLQYVHRHGPWQLFRMEGRFREQQVGNLKRWGCNGIITLVNDAETLRELRSLGVPVLACEPPPSLRPRLATLARSCCVRYDSAAAGRMAADYFLRRNYRHFAFVGDVRLHYWSKERLETFQQTLAAAGRFCHIYTPPKPLPSEWTREQVAMEKWLSTLPKPVAVFAAMDGRARLVLDACMSSGIAVPESVAVLGVDNDELLCESTFPTLSSIANNAAVFGYRMAAELAQMMEGRAPAQKLLLVKPVAVVTRRSTDITQIPDPPVARALLYIWKNGNEKPLHVAEVVGQMGMSRRLAEIRFKTVVGRTILDEILRVRLERVAQLLETTRDSIGEITRRCGFARESYLSRLFAKRYPCTMSAYRRRVVRGDRP